MYIYNQQIAIIKKCRPVIVLFRQQQIIYFEKLKIAIDVIIGSQFADYRISTWSR